MCVLRLRRFLGAALLVLTLTGDTSAAGESAPQLRLPADATYAGAESSPGPVVFSHRTHVSFTGTGCLPCHPGLFSILRPAGRITHDEMNAGKKCGACHNGKAASGVQDACDTCHRGDDP